MTFANVRVRSSCDVENKMRTISFYPYAHVEFGYLTPRRGSVHERLVDHIAAGKRGDFPALSCCGAKESLHCVDISQGLGINFGFLTPSWLNVQIKPAHHSGFSSA